MPRLAPAAVIEWLGAAEGDVGMLGGKAASLDRLARFGFRIPPGFCLTTVAFERHLEALPGARAAIEKLPDEAARASLATAVEAAPLEEGLRRAVDDAVARLAAMVAPANASFAVRSSGVGEDSANASFAGLHATELGVGAPEVAAAIRRCWASLWSQPALAYRARRGLPLDDGAMAVVVQSLVPAEAAAVAFTLHPVTGRDDQLVITAVRGLGDAMVAGTVTPDTFVINRGTLAVVEENLADPASGAALDRARLRELVELVLEVERRFGAAVDVEAALGGGEWHLLQARPITTR